ncbi:MAG: TerB family tellurite resistance protein [Myxococcaceae bacterium]|nr:TerB family tellurite resistance protein [Myxococcaceae bacterium]
MNLGKAGWLSGLLAEAVAAHGPDRPRPVSDVPASPRARARQWLRSAMRESGLLFGTPRELTPSGGPAAPEEQLFLAVIRTFAELGLDLAVIAGAPVATRTEWLFVLFAALCGDFDDAEALASLVGVTTAAAERSRKKLRARVEAHLAERAMSLAGDPAYGLLLHNGAVYVDAETFGRHAIDTFSRGAFRRDFAERRAAWAARRKAMLVEVLAALACAERQPSYPARRAILRQIEDLRLPADVADHLRARVKSFFERRPSSSTVVKNIRGADTRRFLLQQALLAARVDGRTSKEERTFLASLSRKLGFGAEEVHRLELEVAEFYARNRQVVDVFTVSAAAGVMGEEMVSAVQAAAEKNFHRLMQEIRETGELSVLLGRLARGQKLTREEHARMRAQLIDVAKAIPALAIFAAPGGVLLLIALAKVLPFSLLPSAFTEEPAPASNETLDPDDPANRALRRALGLDTTPAGADEEDTGQPPPAPARSASGQ